MDKISRSLQKLTKAIDESSSPFSLPMSMAEKVEKYSALESSDPTTGGLISAVRPWNAKDFHNRLFSFRKTSHWFGKPTKFSPQECARHGWYNSGVDMLTCSSCGSTITCVDDASLTGSELMDSHHSFCGWRDNICPAAFCNFTFISNNSTLEDLSMRALFVLSSLLQELHDELNPLLTIDVSREIELFGESALSALVSIPPKDLACPLSVRCEGARSELGRRVEASVMSLSHLARRVELKELCRSMTRRVTSASATAAVKRNLSLGESWYDSLLTLDEDNDAYRSSAGGATTTTTTNTERDRAVMLLIDISLLLAAQGWTSAGALESPDDSSSGTVSVLLTSSPPASPTPRHLSPSSSPTASGSASSRPCRRFLSCDLCGRHVAWNYFLRAEHPSSASSSSSSLHILKPVHEHRPFCPWIRDTECQDASKSTSAEMTSSTRTGERTSCGSHQTTTTSYRCGWQMVASALASVSVSDSSSHSLVGKRCSSKDGSTTTTSDAVGGVDGSSAALDVASAYKKIKAVLDQVTPASSITTSNLFKL